MKTYLLFSFLCLILFGTVSLTLLFNFTPILSPDFAIPVTTNTVYLKQPYCYFDNIPPSTICSTSPCYIWLAAALSSATSTVDTDKLSGNFISLSPYPNAFSPGNKNYFVTPVGLASNYKCSASGTPPSYFLVGAAGACPATNCNGFLPAGATMRFKYFLLDGSNAYYGETNWSDNITLLTVQSPDSLGSGYAGRSGAMVVITTILCVAAALLLLFLLIALILACCYSKGRKDTYVATRQPQAAGSLRIPSYDVHHLKKSSPYDNPAYDQELKKRYTTSSTLPQKTTTVITTVQSNTVQKM